MPNHARNTPLYSAKRQHRKRRQDARYQERRSRFEQDNLLTLMFRCAQANPRTSMAIFALLMAGGLIGMHLLQPAPIPGGAILPPMLPPAPPLPRPEPRFFCPEPTGPCQQFVKMKTEAWFRDIKHIVHASCQEIQETHGLRAINNPVHFKYLQQENVLVMQWSGFPASLKPHLRTILGRIGEIGALLKQDLVRQLEAEIAIEKPSVEGALLALTRKHGFRGNDAQTVSLALCAPLIAYNHYLGSLISMQISDALTHAVGGGLSLSLASVSALELVRKFDSSHQMPSISIETLYDKTDGAYHSLVRIRPELDSDTGAVYCDPWLHEHQGGQVFQVDGAKRHPFLRSDPGIHAAMEVGKHPDLEGYPEFIRDFYAKKRKQYLFDKYRIPDELQAELKILRNKLDILCQKSGQILGRSDTPIAAPGPGF